MEGSHHPPSPIQLSIDFLDYRSKKWRGGPIREIDQTRADLLPPPLPQLNLTKQWLRSVGPYRAKTGFPVGTFFQMVNGNLSTDRLFAPSKGYRSRVKKGPKREVLSSPCADLLILATGTESNQMGFGCKRARVSPTCVVTEGVRLRPRK